MPINGQVHPRVCGGNPHIWADCTLQSGTSPRVRGKLIETLQTAKGLRYIPACAGETSRGPNLAIFLQVHPRVCGGNITRCASSVKARGTSPRVRGKLILDRKRGLSERYIPACAGETSMHKFSGCNSGVHPRVCGGNGLLESEHAPSDGTSPRVRGKHKKRRILWHWMRYIPACAGETAR